MRILITGIKGYVGCSLATWLGRWPERYRVDHISVRDDRWIEADFSQYDTIVHTAAIVHKKETRDSRDVYFRVNSDLTYRLAEKAKREGVSQFVFLSTISVYGIDPVIGGGATISLGTPCHPKTLYGESKLDAERRIQVLAGPDFHVAILRPPMIYGPNCPGNYALMRKVIMTAVVVPRLSNQRSLIYIDNLTELIKLIIDQRSSGVFVPQNEDYVDTVEMMRLIGRAWGSSVVSSRALASIIRVVGKHSGTVTKAFGSLTVNRALSALEGHDYCVVGFMESIRQTESRWTH